MKNKSLVTQDYNIISIEIYGIINYIFLSMKQNWSKTITYKSTTVVKPATVEELQAIVKIHNHVKVQGTGHTFNWVADTVEGGVLISLEKFKETKVEGTQVTFGAGVTYSDLIVAVDKARLALPNVPSLPHVNVVGSTVTATHGSGSKQPILLAHATAVEMVFADGSVQTITKDHEDFYIYVQSFGGVGIITKMTWQLEPSFKVFKSIYTDLSWDTLKQNQDKIMRGTDYLSFFCPWESRSMSSVWLGEKYYDKPPAFRDVFFGANHIKTQRIHPVGAAQDSSACVTVGEGLWRDKIYHFLPDKPPSSAGEELHTEFFVRYDKFLEAMEELYKIRHVFKHLTQITEIRQVAADNIPNSPAKGQDVVGIHWTWYKKHDEVFQILPQIESVLERFQVKPHYGKLFILSGARLRFLLGNDLDRLARLTKQRDPRGKFGNDFIKRYVFDVPAPKL